MKQSEIVTGESYLFDKTEIEHRKFMEGTVVTVQKILARKKIRFTDKDGFRHIGYNPKKYLLTNGAKCTACELKPLQDVSGQFQK